jgi:hypothetical protein
VTLTLERRMTRAELQELVDRLPELVLDGTPILAVSFDDLQELNSVLIGLAMRLAALTHEWMTRCRHANNSPRAGPADAGAAPLRKRG